MVTPDIEIGITIDSRTYDLMAYRTDMGTWEAVATDIDSAVATPAIDWGAEGDYHSAADALAALAAAVVRRAVPRIRAIDWDSVRLIDDEAGEGCSTTRWRTTTVERHREPGGPIVVPRAVYDGIEAVRQSGVTNMLQRDTVRQVALQLGYEEAYEWIRDHPGLYSQAVFRGLAVEEDQQ